jgi:predicted adenylyl cyclase CyaB
MKNQEVELRVIVSGIGKEDIKQRILALGGISQGIRTIHDIYYCDNKCQTVEDAEMNKVGSFSVRIRKETKNDATTITYNRKIITCEGDHNSWIQKEEERGDFESAMGEMLEKGYKFFFSLDKEREVFCYEDMKICLEDIVDFGLGIEIEIMSTKKEARNAKKRIRALISALDISEQDIVPKSITNIIMHQRAFKSNHDVKIYLWLLSHTAYHLGSPSSQL